MNLLDGTGVEIRVEDQGAAGFAARVTLSRQHEGREATFELVRRVLVLDEAPEHYEEVLFAHRFAARPGETEEFALPGLGEGLFEYAGTQISIELTARVRVHDGFLSDTTGEQVFPQRLFATPRAGEGARELMEQADLYDFGKALAALPAAGKAKVGAFAAISGGLALFTSVAALHDLFVPTSEAWLFLGPAIFTPIAAAALVALTLGGTYLVARRQLPDYLTLILTPPPGGFRRGERYRLGDHFSAVSQVDLHDVCLRIVACNLERGRYHRRRGAGSNQRNVIVSFEEPVRGVQLLQVSLPAVSAGEDLATRCEHPLDFTPLFDALYPEQTPDPAYGLALRCEVQLIHMDYVDKKAAFDPAAFELAGFMAAPDARRP